MSALGSVHHAALTVVVLVAVACTAQPLPSTSPMPSTPPSSEPTLTYGAATSAAATRPSIGSSQTISPSLTAEASPNPTESASPIPTEVASSVPLPNPGGTCSASQLVVGQATSQYETGTIVSSHVGIRQPVQNTGADCVLELPQVVGFADQSGAFQAVEVGNLGQEVCKNAPPGAGVDRICKDVYPTSFQVKSGQTVTIEFRASWYNGNNPGFTPPPCAGTVSDVTRAEFPLASGSIEIVWDTALAEVCTSPSSVSVTVDN